jgi:Ran GTPase-activating protein (RanGAP) involved in mRNA processing and transport
VGKVQALTRIDFSDNTFKTKDCTQKLAQSLLVHQSSLQELILRDDSLSMSTFLNSLQSASFPALKLLDLSGNDIDGALCKKLAQWLISATPNLEALYLDDNDLESEGAKILATAYTRLSSLQSLSLCSCSMQV